MTERSAGKVRSWYVSTLGVGVVAATDFDALAARLADVTRERDEARANVGDARIFADIIANGETAMEPIKRIARAFLARTVPKC